MAHSPFRPRHLLLALLGAAVLGGALLLGSDRARREAERRGAELLGDVATGAEPLHRGALEARRAALEALHAEAEASFQNTYEVDWLQYRMRQTDAALAQAL